MIEWDGNQVAVGGPFTSANITMMATGAALGLLGAILIAKALRVSAAWTYGIGAVAFSVAAVAGMAMLIGENGPDIYLVGPQFTREMLLLAAAMGVLGLVCASIGWRRARQSARCLRASLLAGLGGVGGGWAATGFVFLQSGAIVDDNGLDSHGSTALEFFLPAFGFLLMAVTLAIALGLLLRNSVAPSPTAPTRGVRNIGARSHAKADRPSPAATVQSV